MPKKKDILSIKYILKRKSVKIIVIYNAKQTAKVPRNYGKYTLVVFTDKFILFNRFIVLIHVYLSFSSLDTVRPRCLL